jgi:hypothetical protein
MIKVPTIFDFDQGNSKARCGLKPRPGVHPAQGAAAVAFLASWKKDPLASILSEGLLISGFNESLCAHHEINDLGLSQIRFYRPGSVRQPPSA